MANGNFQTSVQNQPAVAIAGNFASNNPRSSVLAGAGGLVSGAAGLTVGVFAWIDSFTQQTSSFSLSGGLPAGFVAHELTSTIQTWFDGSSNIILAGQQVTLFNSGDFWVKPVTQAIRGQKVFARFADGAIVTGAAGSIIAGLTSTASSVAAQAATSVTASIAQSVTPSGGYGMAIMTVTVVGSGAIVKGGLLAGANVAVGTHVLAQLTGTAGGVGTYEVSIAQTAASATVTQTSGTLTIGGTVVGTLAVGSVISGTGVVAGTTVLAFLTGTGGAGTYVVSDATVVASTAIAASGAIETNFFVDSNSAANELCKISSKG
jgi:hypothetical protein